MTSRQRPNIDAAVVEGFGREWQTFDQTALSEQEQRALFSDYFAVFPWETLAVDAVGFDLGCGSGRWAALVAPRVGHLHCIDPSDAIEVARIRLAECGNVTCHRASVDGMPIAEGSMDFGYSLGVLHHIPDTAAGLEACVRKLKPRAPFLLYLYYRFDNRSTWFRVVWHVSDFVRRIVSKLPHPVKLAVTQLLAAAVYWPMARTAKALERLGVDVEQFPLSAYRNRSFYTMRTDALDRFGTSLERRFTRREIAEIMNGAGLERIAFSERVPFWCAVGYRKPS